MDQQTLSDARSGLIKHSMIAWQKPVYQVLCLEPRKENNRQGSFISFREILTVGGGK